MVSVSIAMLMMDKSTSSTRPQQPLGWSIKLLPALKRSTDGCPRKVWSWILRKRKSYGWAVDNSFRRSASITFISATMLLLPSQQSAISGFISTANWQWRCMCSVSAGHHSTSSGSSGPCVARSPLMHVQPLYSLLAGIGDGLIDQLQTVMRVAARLVLRKHKFDLISADIRDRLHWLPIRSRIDFKLGLLVYKCLHGIAHPYLTEMLVLKSTVPALSRLRSTARGDLLVPRTKTKTIGPRSFATSGPAIWNSLPDDLRDPSLSLAVFKQRLKSYLFKQCWCVIQPKLTFAATFQLMH